MLSYQHMYHAGNLADVHKHLILSALLNKLIEKNKPLTYFESHAGRGLYNLNSLESLKTKEAEEGVIKFLQQGKILESLPYFKVLEKVKSIYGNTSYPGSPLIAKEILRTTDELHLMELHPTEYLMLKNNMKFKNVHIHKIDGLKGVLALAPPKIRRGFILVDPSYEVKEEYDFVFNFIKDVHNKWKEAVIMLWYPILETLFYVNMVRKIHNLNLPKMLTSEVMFKETSQRMKGSGVIIINTPYLLNEEILLLEKIFH